MGRGALRPRPLLPGFRLDCGPNLNPAGIFIWRGNEASSNTPTAITNRECQNSLSSCITVNPPPPPSSMYCLQAVRGWFCNPVSHDNCVLPWLTGPYLLITAEGKVKLDLSDPPGTTRLNPWWRWSCLILSGLPVSSSVPGWHLIWHSDNAADKHPTLIQSFKVIFTNGPRPTSTISESYWDSSTESVWLLNELQMVINCRQQTQNSCSL